MDNVLTAKRAEAALEAVRDRYNTLLRLCDEASMLGAVEAIEVAWDASGDARKVALDPQTKPRIAALCEASWRSVSQQLLDFEILVQAVAVRRPRSA